MKRITLVISSALLCAMSSAFAAEQPRCGEGVVATRVQAIASTLLSSQEAVMKIHGRSGDTLSIGKVYQIETRKVDRDSGFVECAANVEVLSSGKIQFNPIRIGYRVGHYDDSGDLYVNKIDN
jgi:hypothetical protein